jgi:acyl dehydratase
MLTLGQTTTVTRAFSPEDLRGFAAIVGLHSAAFTALPEPLLAALFSYILGVKLPGRGTNYLKQDMQFLKPVPLTETVTATLEITKLRPEKHLCDLATTLTDAAGEILVTGRALVYIKDVEGAL